MIIASCILIAVAYLYASHFNILSMEPAQGCLYSLLLGLQRSATGLLWRRISVNRIQKANRMKHEVKRALRRGARYISLYSLWSVMFEARRLTYPSLRSLERQIGWSAVTLRSSSQRKGYILTPHLEAVSFIRPVIPTICCTTSSFTRKNS